MMRQLSGTELKRLHRARRRQSSGRIRLLLDNVQTPYNVGGIVRSAASFRVEHLYLAGATTSPLHPQAKKTALGTERYLTWSEHADADAAVATAKADGFTVVGIDLLEGAEPIDVIDIADDVCLAFGHESNGLGRAILPLLDAVAYIPQLGKVGSLNVASAAAIAIYEASRRHWST